MTRQDQLLPSDQSTMVVDGLDSESEITERGKAPDAVRGGNDPVAELAVPPSVGRYLIIEQVGKGGMGTVHSAFDPELERTVAVKLMYAASSQERLRREAQAIARVSHPNVISVYDVGYFESGGQLGVFMVMELVDGIDLDAWLELRERSWREIVGVFVQAGRGLEAAHHEGVIHRDFKPANVLVNSRGCALVLDFGLARGVGPELIDEDEGSQELSSSELVESSGELGAADSGSSSGSASMSASASLSAIGRSGLLTAQLTRHGTIMGTPRFMSPEQHLSSDVDARSDQYSFCLTLYAALYRKHPFATEELDGFRALIKAKRAGAVKWDAPGVPEHVQAALRRGMAPRPEDRWPDMASLVDALEDDPSLRRRRWLLGVATAICVVVSIGAGLAWDARVESRCEDQRDWLAEVWGPQAHESVEAAFTAVDQPYASSALAHARAELDAYASSLGQGRAQLCLDEHRAELEPSIISARRLCLDERKAQLGVVVTRLASADATLVEHTVDVLSTLPSVSPCAGLSDYAERSDDAAARDTIERDLFAVRLSAAEGREQDALKLFDAVLERARALEAPLTLTLVLTRGGELHGAARKLERSEALASEAALLAEQLGEHDLAIDALTCLAKTLSNLRGRWDDAQRTLDLARAKYTREPGGSKGEWHFHYIQASIHMQHRRFDEAVAEHQAGTQAAREGGSAMDLAKVLQARARAELSAGHVDEAEAHVLESIEIRTELYGLDHPNLMYPYRALAMIAAERDDYDAALERLALVIGLGEHHHGADAPGLAEPHNERAKSLRRLGRYEDALVEYEEVLRLRQVNGSPVSEALRLQSQIQLRLGRWSQALDLAERALAAHREELGEDEQVPWLRARFVMHRGEALLALGRLDEALIDFERGAELRAANKQDSLMLRIWTGEGRCRLALGDLPGARQVFEQALAHREAGHSDNKRTDGHLDFGLARTSEEPETSQRWARSAIAAFEAHGGDDDLADEVRAWIAVLERHPPD